MLLLFSSARRHVATARGVSEAQGDAPMVVTPDVSLDLGWRAPEELKRKRRKSKSAVATDGDALDDLSSREAAEAAKVSLVLASCGQAIVRADAFGATLTIGAPHATAQRVVRPSCTRPAAAVC